MLSTILQNLTTYSNNHATSLEYITPQSFKDVENYNLNILNNNNIDINLFNPAKYLSVRNNNTPDFNKLWVYYHKDSATNTETSMFFKLYVPSRDTLILNGTELI